MYMVLINFLHFNSGKHKLTFRFHVPLHGNQSYSYDSPVAQIALKNISNNRQAIINECHLDSLEIQSEGLSDGRGIYAVFSFYADEMPNLISFQSRAEDCISQYVIQAEKIYDSIMTVINSLKASGRL